MWVSYALPWESVSSALPLLALVCTKQGVNFLFVLIDYCLIHWVIENSVSVLPLSNVVGDAVVGEERQVKLGRSIYPGTVVAIGMLEE